MLTALTLTLATPFAAAQTREEGTTTTSGEDTGLYWDEGTTGTGGSYDAGSDPTTGGDPSTGAGSDWVDPEYLDYLRQLEIIQGLDFAPGPQPQLWDGMVGLLDMYGKRKGTIFVGGPANPKQELWFMPNMVNPSAAFGFEHLGWYPPGTEAQQLSILDKNWDVHPCYAMWAAYTVKPDENLTAHLDYTNGITRTHFELWQNGDLVGHLLREHHQIANTPEKFVDHWSFYDIYAFPNQIGEQLWANPSNVQYQTTSAYFDDRNDEQAEWLAHSQIQYTRKPGWQCLANLSF